MPSIQQPRGPNPTTARGVITSFSEGIVLAVINKIVVLMFNTLASVQQQFTPETALVDLSLYFTAWGITYFILAFLAPIIAAYVWADKTGVTVYCVGWLGTSLILSQQVTVGVLLLFAAIVLVLIVDLIKNVGKNQDQAPYRY